jgi:hypothetical protein
MILLIIALAVIVLATYAALPWHASKPVLDLEDRLGPGDAGPPQLVDLWEIPQLSSARRSAARKALPLTWV